MSENPCGSLICVSVSYGYTSSKIYPYDVTTRSRVSPCVRFRPHRPSMETYRDSHSRSEKYMRERRRWSSSPLRQEGHPQRHSLRLTHRLSVAASATRLSQLANSIHPLCTLAQRGSL